jgi:hypothetical protein
MTAGFQSERATVASFLEVWKAELRHATTVREAYERAEDRHERAYGRRRFSEFSSFCRARRNFATRHQGRR